MKTIPEFYLGELSKEHRRKMNDLVSRVTLAATMHGRGSDVMAYVYMAGLYHGSSIAPKITPTQRTTPMTEKLNEITSFGFTKRNPGHWDVNFRRGHKPSTGRAFRVRGGPHEMQWGGDGQYHIFDERDETKGKRQPVDGMKFPDLMSAVMWIASTLMIEPKDETP